MDMRRWGPLVFVLLMVLSFATSSAAQTETASLSGRLTDPNGGVVPNAQVELTNIDTNIRTTTTTNGEGLYAFPNVRPGRYRLTIAKEGFKQIAKTDIVLNVQDVIALNFALEIGSVNETVTVLGGTPLVNTESAAVSTVVDRKFVENMPLNGRSFQTLIQLTPGVVMTSAAPNEQGQFSVNGQRADANYFTVDGVSANISAGAGSTVSGQFSAGALPGLSAQGGTNSLVSVDAMQEFRIQTSTFAPEFGRTPGAQVSIVTRSGTNDFHGTAFDYLRNDALDANDWFNGFNNNPPLPKGKDRQNDFGGTLGGPLLKDRTFFFFSYEGLRLRLPQTKSTSVLSTAFRASAPAQIRPFLNAFPIANGPAVSSTSALFTASYSDPSSLDAYSVRFDHNVSSRVTLFGRYSYAPSDVGLRAPLFALSNILSTHIRPHTLTLGTTASLTSALANEFRANLSNLRAEAAYTLDSFGGAAPLDDSLLFPSGFSSANSRFLFSIPGASLFIGRNQLNEQRQLNFVDNVTATVRSHQLKFGVDYRWLAPINDPNAYLQGAIFNAVTGAVSVSSAVASTDLIQAQQQASLLVKNFSAYAQDMWKAHPRLTLTYGLRWDVNPTITGKNSANEPAAVVGLDNPATMTLAPFGTSLYGTTYGNVAPRVGVAYVARQKSGWETVVRGGFGIFYDLGSGALGQVATGFPFTAQKLAVNVPFPLTTSQAAPPIISRALPQTGIMFVADPRLRLPKTYQWNAAVEQSIASHDAITATYIGAVGRDLLRQDSLSNPNPNFQTVRVTRNTATSDYHALQLKYQRRLSRGLQALASYTLAHSIDIASDDSSFFNTPVSRADPRIDRGNSNFDVRHTFSSAISYDLPSARNNAIVRAISSGWGLENLIVARSAPPVTITTGTSTVIGGTLFSPRPNVVGGVPLYLFGSQFSGGKAFNKAAFVNPAAGQQGNFGRNVLRGLGAWQADVAVRRQFPITDRVGLQFRADFFNIFNHPNFGIPTSTLNSATFGQATSMLNRSLGQPAGGLNAGTGLSSLYELGGPRSIQVALKLRF